VSDEAHVREHRSVCAPRVQNVIFDVGGVLLEWNPAKILADFCANPELHDLLRRYALLQAMLSGAPPDGALR